MRTTSSWKGDMVGEGSATITESKPGELVRQRMDWKKPMEGVSTVDFTFKSEGDKTVVTWAIYGKNGFMGKVSGEGMKANGAYERFAPPGSRGASSASVRAQTSTNRLKVRVFVR